MRELWAFALASFFNDVGSDMIAPIWAIFITQVLGGNASILGLIDGIAVAIVAVAKGLSGWLSDYFKKRKPFIAAGYFLSSISRLGYYYSTTPLQVIPFKVLDRFGKIRGAPRNAMLVEIIKKKRGRAFGILRSMDSLGAVVGTLITLSIISFVPIRSIMLFALIPSLASVFLIMFLVKERKSKVKFSGFSLSLPKSLRHMLVLMSIFTFFSFGYSFLILYSKQTNPIYDTILFYLILNITYSLSAYWFGRVSDNYNRFKIFSLGFLFFVFSNILLLSGVFILSFVFFGLYLAVSDTLQKTIVSELAPKGRKGGIIGTYDMILGLIAIPGGFFMGHLFDLNPSFPFLLSSLISLVVCLFFLKEKYILSN